MGRRLVGLVHRVCSSCVCCFVFFFFLGAKSVALETMEKGTIYINFPVDFCFLRKCSSAPLVSGTSCTLVLFLQILLLLHCV